MSDRPAEHTDDPVPAADGTGGSGDAGVHDAVRRLDELSGLPPAEHVEVYESVHHALQESLAAAAQESEDEPRDSPP